ncbi:hypothetical protein OHB35_16575 [Streptomyces phaeochromogenes]|uniref:Lipoprotein n=1 Tax=Streptomyces phaeochromogenes TaxID=1923 RepID=A0ABZ1H828_STRPH|nr:hypothetical protein [Streptomyces phaeochromogenes]WSD14729.1 hypothetical protein OHB35_16575 [Streptomyces phaeochromogenes]
MPFTLPSRIPSGPRRRSLLAGAAGVGAALLTGCSSSDSSSGTTGGSTSAAERARARAARDSERLAERYEAVLAVHPALAERLSPLRAEVVRHAKAFGGGKGASKSASPSASASESPSPGPSAEVPAVEKDALAELAAAERTLADRRTKALMDAPGELARLLASVAAAGAVHAFLLTEGEK